MSAIPAPPSALVTLGDLGDVSLHTQAWTGTNSHVLTDPPAFDHQNLEQPGVDGELGQPGLIVARVTDLKVDIWGDQDTLGDPHPSWLEGLEANVAAFTTDVYLIDRDEFGEVTCRVSSTIPGKEHRGKIQMTDLVYAAGIRKRTAFIKVKIPAGWLPLVDIEAGP